MARPELAVTQALPARTAERPALNRVYTAENAAATPLYVTVLLWVMALAFAAFFTYYAWLRYHTFLMHAEDMGNMEQALWNTIHGQPFHFTNLRFPMAVDPASGTSTRLSYHVEPILLLIAIPFFLHPSPVTLITVQALVVATGVFPAAWLAKRHLTMPLAQLAFPLAYLLAPPLQAATLYEFHAVTLSAALLLWALYFADGRRYGLFALCAILALATKEEIGLVVALMGLWLWWRHRDRALSNDARPTRGRWRHRDRTVGLTTAILGAGWSLFCVFVIMPHFHHTALAAHTPSSPFCSRFNPYIMNGHTGDPNAGVKSCGGVLKIWLQHPNLLSSVVFTTAKLGFLHRLLVTSGYLALLSPLTLAISLPSYAVILLSNDVHMYSGLGHYPAELVPLLIGAAILGTAWLAHTVGPRLRLPPAVLTTVCCLWLLVSSLANARVNGFTPLAPGVALPADTPHAQVGRRLLSLIPPTAAVSAGDYLNPHLSDRAGIYLFPDIADARYAIVDVTQDKFPLTPGAETAFIRDSMLKNGVWGIVAAEDGYILLERRQYDPTLPTTLPQSFYSFVQPATPPPIAHPMRVQFGPSLQLLGYDLERREQVNVRQPDIVMTTYWRLTGPATSPITPVLYLTNGTGAIDVAQNDHPGTDWLPIPQWPLGRVMALRTVSMAIYAPINGHVDIDLAVYRPGAFDVLNDAVDRYRPAVTPLPGQAAPQVVAGGTILKLAQVSSQW